MNKRLLEKALRTLVMDHPVLRTTLALMGPGGYGGGDGVGGEQLMARIVPMQQFAFRMFEHPMVICMIDA